MRYSCSIKTSPHIQQRQEQIKQLRNEGKPRKVIAETLGITIYQVDYCLTQPDTAERQDWARRARSKRSSHGLRHRLHGWKRRKAPDKDFTFDDVVKKFGNQPCCALSGLPIDFQDSRTYELDHIVPVCDGGSGNLDNMQLVRPEINMMKACLHEETFVRLCGLVAVYRASL